MIRTALATATLAAVLAAPAAAHAQDPPASEGPQERPDYRERFRAERDAERARAEGEDLSEYEREVRRAREEGRTPPPAPDPFAWNGPDSLFGVEPVEPREWAEHDLLTVVVSETIRTSAQADASVETETTLDAELTQWIRFRNPGGLLDGLSSTKILPALNGVTPSIDLDSERESEGEGDTNRTVRITDEFTVEVLEILPNGNLVIEGRTQRRTDDETTTATLTGVVDPRTVTNDGRVDSKRIGDLVLEITGSGPLRDAQRRGALGRLIDIIWPF